MLTENHPLRPIVKQLWRYVITDNPTPAQVEFRMILIRLENGLFERLPQPVISAICRHEGNLNEVLHPTILEIAKEVSEGTIPSDTLMNSFYLRMEHSHGEISPWSKENANIVPFDPPV